jgi:4-diphosphocytidyl-2-C-methyl-D-erythritol kinase
LLAQAYQFRGGLLAAIVLISQTAGGNPPLKRLSLDQLSIPAFAKINLGLRILGKRDDGYHELDTIFQTISLHDTIGFTATGDGSIVTSCDDLSLGMGETNLVTRAAKLLQARFDPRQGARIHLQKRIPWQAGLGGGSADAAVTFIGLSRLWELPARPTELIEIAAGLGADISFFFFGGTARGTGIGDKIEPLPDPREIFLLIIKPNANINTANAYEALQKPALTSTNSKTILSSSEAKEFFDSSSFAALQNDFEAIAFSLEPEIERAKAALLKAGARAALLAGSGSAVFGIFDSEDAQRRAIQAIELETGWRVFPCKTVGREQYQAALYSVSKDQT